MDFKEEGKRNLEIVSGNGENLDISPVYSHIPISKPNTNNVSDKKIVIPMQNNLS